jgi:hypothetical protein
MKQIRGCSTEEWGFDYRQRQKKFLFSTAFSPALGSIQPPVQWVWGRVGPFLEVKRNGVKMITCSLSASAEAKTAWSYTSTA